MIRQKSKLLSTTTFSFKPLTLDQKDNYVHHIYELNLFYHTMLVTPESFIRKALRYALFQHVSS